MNILLPFVIFQVLKDLLKGPKPEYPGAAKVPILSNNQPEAHVWSPGFRRGKQLVHPFLLNPPGYGSCFPSS